MGFTKSDAWIVFVAVNIIIAFIFYYIGARAKNKQKKAITELLIVAGLMIIYLTYTGIKGKEPYDYQRENPNALICGKNIAGTVYAAYPEKAPGLGWIV